MQKQGLGTQKRASRARIHPGWVLCWRTCLLLLCVLVRAWTRADAAEPALAVVKSSQPSLLVNGDFEAGSKTDFSAWHPAPNGYLVGLDEGRNHSRAMTVESRSDVGWFGASQTIVLNRSVAAPLLIEGWSKATDVSGASDSGYSLYVDLAYQDGSPLWGRTAEFAVGTHDWQRRRLTIFPDKPVKTVTLHCLFRAHTGKAWFDDVHLEELAGGADVEFFQGAAVSLVEQSAPLAATSRTAETQDGLRLELADGALAISRNQRGGDRASQTVRGTFLVRDAAAESGFFECDGGGCGALGLKLTADLRSGAESIAVEGRIEDVTGKNRAVTVVFGLPIDAQGWRWGDDIRVSREISGRGEFSKQVSVKCGATGSQSVYPVAPIWHGDEGLALGLDMARPAVFRVGYHAGLRLLYIAYDFGLVPETEHFPSSALFRLIVYRFPAKDGFRAAWDKFMRIFPEQFKVRSGQQGLWMPFTDVSTVAGWEDFGFRYHESNNNVPWDDAHDILSFRYTEPMTWWMPMGKEIPRTVPGALRVRDELAGKDPPGERGMAQISELAAMQDESGQSEVLFRNTPWADGAVWSLNPNPWLSSPGSTTNHLPLNAATVYWNDTVRERLYGPGAKGRLDGEYLDSLEGYVTAELNFRRDHFRFSTVPLTFSTETKRPALFKGLAVFEFTHWLAEDIHGMGKLMFANGVPYRLCYLCPWLDVLGTETDWLANGRYHPVPVEVTDLWRTLSGAKPYLLLMNTDYDAFTSDLVEKYFQRALFYGIWPGFFSHNAADNPYWQNPRWYERDRPLFQQYIPLIRRVAEAGWNPIPGAVCDNPNLLVERFGRQQRSYLTFFNASPAPQSGTLTVESSDGGPRFAPRALLGAPPEKVNGSWRLSLDTNQSAVWELGD